MLPDITFIDELLPAIFREERKEALRCSNLATLIEHERMFANKIVDELDNVMMTSMILHETGNDAKKDLKQLNIVWPGDK